MLPSKDELEKKRSPLELREFAQRIRDEVSASPSHFRDGIMHKGLHKEFIDEILPLSYFALQQYPSTYLVRPVIGNQGYDAIVYDESEVECDHVELTNPHDGKTRHESDTLVCSRGFGLAKGAGLGDEIVPSVPFILETCRKKARKDYRDCTLVIVAWVHRLSHPIPAFEHRYEANLRNLVKQLSAFEFKARRVILFVPPDRLLTIQSTIG